MFGKKAAIGFIATPSIAWAYETTARLVSSLASTILNNELGAST